MTPTTVAMGGLLVFSLGLPAQLQAQDRKDDSSFRWQGVIASGKTPGNHDLIGDAMALAAAAFYAGSLLISAQLYRRNEASGVTFWVILGAAVGTLPFALAESVLLPQTLPDLGYLSFYGFITYGAYALYNSALSKLPTTLVAISGYGQPVIATGLAALLLNEIPSTTSFVGALIIVAGLVLATKS